MTSAHDTRKCARRAEREMRDALNTRWVMQKWINKVYIVKIHLIRL